MKWQRCLLSLVLLASPAFAQNQAPETADLIPPAPVQGAVAEPAAGGAPVYFDDSSDRGSRGFLNGNHNFDNFIGFMSNPVFNIDPRAVTEIWPIFGSTWTSSVPALPSANIWIPGGAGIYLALSERLSVGINQGGYIIADFSRGQPGPFADRFGHLRNRLDFSGQREGWLDLGGFAQYTLIQNVADQFLLTAGLRWTAPIGSSAVFQGNGPANLAPYLTAGKAFGNFHLLATGGYQFPAGPGSNLNLFYGSVHLDRQTFGWLYPLVEFNGIYHTNTVSLDLPTRLGFLNFGDFETTGNLVTLAAGANAVLIRSKLEAGMVYTTSIATQRNFGFNGFLEKLVYRY
jgi:hypothetical protein